jgi:hypothetical protein
MKMLRFLLALVWVGVFWLPVEAGARTCSEFGDLHRWYGEADAVALVRVTGIEQGSTAGMVYSLDVLQSWKKKVLEPPVLPVNHFGTLYGYGGVNAGTEGFLIDKKGLLYLYEDENKKFVPGGTCAGDLWGNDENIHDRMEWLDRVMTCGCKVFDTQGLHDAADVVVLADVTKVVEKGMETFAEIDAFVLWSTFEHDSRVLRLTVFTGDGQHKGCGYPIKQGEKHTFYLRRDQESRYLTGICSGNLIMPNGSSRPKFKMEQPEPRKKVKAEKAKQCACEKLSVKERYDRADIVVLASVSRFVEKGTTRLADLDIAYGWKTTNLPRYMTVNMGDVNSECRYLISQENRRHILYLRRDDKDGFSTDYCSGNLMPSDDIDKCVRWLNKQEKKSLSRREDTSQEDACLKR